MTSDETKDSRKDMADGVGRTLAKLTGRDAKGAGCRVWRAAPRNVVYRTDTRRGYRRFLSYYDEPSSRGDQMAIQSVLDELCSVLDVQMFHHRVLMKSHRTR